MRKLVKLKGSRWWTKPSPSPSVCVCLCVSLCVWGVLCQAHSSLSSCTLLQHTTPENLSGSDTQKARELCKPSAPVQCVCFRGSCRFQLIHYHKYTLKKFFDSSILCIDCEYKMRGNCTGSRNLKIKIKEEKEKKQNIKFTQPYCVCFSF